MFFSVFLLASTLFLGIFQCSELSEPDQRLLPRFDWLEKLLERSIRTDLQMQEYNKAVEKALESIKNHNQEFEGLKTNIVGLIEELKLTVENQTRKLDEMKENVTKLQERMLIPTVQFSAKGVGDASPNQNQVIVFPTVLHNIGNAYNPGTGVFTAPVNGTYLFSMQACTYSSKWAQFQLVVDSGNNIILVHSKYNDATQDTTSSSVPHYLNEGQRVWVQSLLNSGTTATLYFADAYCWNHFSGVLVNN